MGAVASVLKKLLPDDVVHVEERFRSIVAEIASTEAEKSAAERELAEREGSGDVKAADAADARLRAADDKLRRLRVRRVAVESALDTARAAKAEAERVERTDALKAAHAKAGKTANETQTEAVALALKLGDALSSYFAAANGERDAQRQLSRDGVEVSNGFRGLVMIEDAARAGRVGETVEVRIPIA